MCFDISKVLSMLSSTNIISFHCWSEMLNHNNRSLACYCLYQYHYIYYILRWPVFVAVAIFSFIFAICYGFLTILTYIHDHARSLM